MRMTTYDQICASIHKLMSQSGLVTVRSTYTFLAPVRNHDYQISLLTGLLDRFDRSCGIIGFSHTSPIALSLPTRFRYNAGEPKQCNLHTFAFQIRWCIRFIPVHASPGVSNTIFLEIG
ncbi:hypothetical protein D3C74_408600 [compost metagenome]